MSEMGTCEACNKDCHTGLIEAQAEIARLRTEIAAFQGLMTNVVPGDGSGEEVPATPESLRIWKPPVRNTALGGLLSKALAEIASLKRQLAERDQPTEGQYFCLGGCHNIVNHKLELCNTCTTKQAQTN